MAKPTPHEIRKGLTLANANADSDWPESCQQRENESSDQYLGFSIFLELGRARSLRKAYHEYQVASKIKASDIPYDPKQSVSSFFHDWSVLFDWQKRKDDYDNWTDSMRNRAKTAHKATVEESEWLAYDALNKQWWAQMRSRTENFERPLSPEELTRFLNNRKAIDDMGRRAAGLPATISEIKQDITSGGKPTKLTAMEVTKQVNTPQSSSNEQQHLPPPAHKVVPPRVTADAADGRE
jgi:hypothetical protein